MAVRINETGEQCLAAEIDDFGRRTFQFEHVGLVTHGQDSAVLDGECFRRGCGVVHRDDVSTLKNDVGGVHG